MIEGSIEQGRSFSEKRHIVSMAAVELISDAVDTKPGHL